MDLATLHSLHWGGRGSRGSVTKRLRPQRWRPDVHDRGVSRPGAFAGPRGEAQCEAPPGSWEAQWPRVTAVFSPCPHGILPWAGLCPNAPCGHPRDPVLPWPSATTRVPTEVTFTGTRAQDLSIFGGDESVVLWRLPRPRPAPSPSRLRSLTRAATCIQFHERGLYRPSFLLLTRLHQTPGGRAIFSRFCAELTQGACWQGEHSQQAAPPASGIGITPSHPPPSGPTRPRGRGRGARGRGLLGFLRR